MATNLTILQSTVVLWREQTESVLTTYMRSERGNLVTDAIAVGKFVSIANQYVNEPESLDDRWLRARTIGQMLQGANLSFYHFEETRIPTSEEGLKDALGAFEADFLGHVKNAAGYREAVERGDIIANILIRLLFGLVYDSDQVAAPQGGGGAAAADPASPQAEVPEISPALAPPGGYTTSKCAKGMVWNPATQCCE